MSRSGYRENVIEAGESIGIECIDYDDILLLNEFTDKPDSFEPNDKREKTTEAPRPILTAGIFGAVIWFSLLAAFQNSPFATERELYPIGGALLSAFFLSQKHNNLEARGSGFYLVAVIGGIITPFVFYANNSNPIALFIAPFFGFFVWTLPLVYLGYRQKKKSRKKYGIDLLAWTEPLPGEEVLIDRLLSQSNTSKIVGTTAPGRLYITNHRILYNPIWNENNWKYLLVYRLGRTAKPWETRNQRNNTCRAETSFPGDYRKNT